MTASRHPPQPPPLVLPGRAAAVAVSDAPPLRCGGGRTPGGCYSECPAARAGLVAEEKALFGGWGLVIPDQEEVQYIRVVTKGVVGRSVMLECGSSLPNIYFWGFTQPGTVAIRSLVYGYGQGPRMQKLASTLGELSVISGSASLVIDKLSLLAEGLYTCQALYDSNEGANVTFYHIQLLVLVPVSKPSIVVSESSPVENEPLWMECRLENGTGPIQYLWEREGQDRMVVTVAEANGSLVNLTGVNRNHTGWYSCRARNEVNEERSQRIWLDIIYGPDEPIINITPYAVSDRGYTAVELDTVSLLCQAPSNPPSQYVWFYNNSQVYAGQQLTISKILRMHTGYYTCLAQNSFLNTRTKTTVTLTVYYLPDGNPTCNILPANNYTDLTLWCSWEGGYPLASLSWNPPLPGESEKAGGSFSNATQLRLGSKTLDKSTFTCQASHPALKTSATCTLTAMLPPVEPGCFAVATQNNEYLMLSCNWEGGSPRALLQWVSGDGVVQGSSEENANIVVIKSSGAYSGKQFVCRAKHPLSTGSQQCQLKLEAPVLVTQRSVVSVFEGSDVQLTCVLKATYPASEITWYNNQRKKVWDAPQKYLLHREAAWANLTVRETDGAQDSGQYWCSATNAVGGAQIPITLNVQRYPSPPNVTISKILYNTRQRTEVELEWATRGTGDLTGFVVERQMSSRSGERGAWEMVANEIEPHMRGHKIAGLDPGTLYAFRILAINHRTRGYPSEVKTPADPPFNAYPAVIGAAVAGMIVATVGTLLVFQYVVRNRTNNPRLHNMLFGMPPAESRENISNPEDEEGAGGLQGPEGGGEASEEGGAAASSPSPPTDAPPPVNVTITVTATS
ncbi:V-set and immunoglobulin domain-containing protein 10-like 2 [Amia ocellicauda]|uniref:V-set and immunoglobulin domain-containing protein 10-like 2 n=1 Tax=Amia ocellicauda TaxID=2972642 RepID=UPI0034648AAD